MCQPIGVQVCITALRTTGSWNLALVESCAALKCSIPQMHLFVLEIGFWIQDPLFSAFLMGKMAYNPIAFGQVNA